MTGAVQDILVEVSPGETRAAVIDRDGRLIGLHIERLGESSLLGAVCYGRVRRIEKGIGGAFVDAGLAVPCFLARAKGLHEGETLIVQVSRDGWGDKAPALTRAPVLAGRYLVLRPTETGLHWPRSLSGRARDSVETMLTPITNGDDGFTVLRNAALADADALRHEADQLRRQWRDLVARAGQVAAPAVLSPAPGLLDRLLRNESPAGRIVIDDRRLVAKIAAQAAATAPDLGNCVAFHDDPAPLFAAAGAEEEIATALSRRVTLGRGASLVIDELEALTAVDVNMGGAGGNRASEDAIFRVNGEAAETAARQIMLRNIAGLIVIDFISMRNKANRRKLVEQVRRAFAADRVAVDVLGMTPAGLVEVTRQRRGPSLAAVMLAGSRGDAPLNAPASACAALRAALRQLGAGRPVLRCAPAVADVLDGSLRPALDEVSRRLGQALRVEADARCPEYEIVQERRS